MFTIRSSSSILQQCTLEAFAPVSAIWSSGYGLPVVDDTRGSSQDCQCRLGRLFGGFGHNFDTAEGAVIVEIEGEYPARQA